MCLTVWDAATVRMYVPARREFDEQKNWDYCVKEVAGKQNLVDVKSNVKNSQFATPLFEFSGACAGCGETPYVKLITQLFGDRQIVSNATGCSSIYSGSVPSTPYCENEKGEGPAWANSLFEDFCEYGMGMTLAYDKMRSRLVDLLSAMMESSGTSEAYKAAAQEWLDNKEDADGSRTATEKLLPLVKESAAAGCETCKEILTLSHYLIKRSHWIIGGDGASYDIGFGGLDHVIDSGRNPQERPRPDSVYLRVCICGTDSNGRGQRADT